MNTRKLFIIFPITQPHDKKIIQNLNFSNGEGGYSGEISSRTYSDIPADPPQNVTLEPASSTSLIGKYFRIKQFLTLNIYIFCCKNPRLIDLIVEIVVFFCNN